MKHKYTLPDAAWCSFSQQKLWAVQWGQHRSYILSCSQYIARHIYISVWCFEATFYNCQFVYHPSAFKQYSHVFWFIIYNINGNSNWTHCWSQCNSMNQIERRVKHKHIMFHINHFQGFVPWLRQLVAVLSWWRHCIIADQSVLDLCWM